MIVAGRQFFRLHAPAQEAKRGDDNYRADGEPSALGITNLSRCSVNPHHLIYSKDDLAPNYIRLKHNDRTEEIIWPWNRKTVVHEKLFAVFESEGFTGFRRRAAVVEFKDGSKTSEYEELVVTGWGGVAPPESGIKVVKRCPGCHWARYSHLEDEERIIDWTQWSGDDFFLIWPLSNFVFITSRVASWLSRQKPKSFVLHDHLRSSYQGGYTVGRLGQALPEDLALRYGVPLGIESPPV